MLELLWIKVEERFVNVATAFRFFDKDSNQKINFNEFNYGIE